mmetsp:Transcript_5776/g.35878  ORF Transcript_5776/g.35878 Transcript_5776/m.35878 type:complete len:283 (-) Transcript_5776:616-1464(-)
MEFSDGLSFSAGGWRDCSNPSTNTSKLSHALKIDSTFCADTDLARYPRVSMSLYCSRKGVAKRTKFRELCRTSISTTGKAARRTLRWMSVMAAAMCATRSGRKGAMAFSSTLESTVCSNTLFMAFLTCASLSAIRSASASTTSLSRKRSSSGFLAMVSAKDSTASLRACAFVCLVLASSCSKVYLAAPPPSSSSSCSMRWTGMCTCFTFKSSFTSLADLGIRLPTLRFNLRKSGADAPRRRFGMALEMADVHTTLRRCKRRRRRGPKRKARAMKDPAYRART